MDTPTVLPVSLLVSSVGLRAQWASLGRGDLKTRAPSPALLFPSGREAQVRCVFFRHRAQFSGARSRTAKSGCDQSIMRPQAFINVETVRLAGVACSTKVRASKARKRTLVAPASSIIPRDTRSTRHLVCGALFRPARRRLARLKRVVRPRCKAKGPRPHARDPANARARRMS
jgi:hypothetical protein